ncbi:Choline transpo domain containing protein [Asbolus verrucosus]|uniref:Choline transporter-like protein n=1 Tax=Asbolus verrucosus TaxID=1661398 RepID=A0A482W2M7_ASBVE|nr:Choline transpo domain containing protein [Asbolus verrucosus]
MQQLLSFCCLECLEEIVQYLTKKAYIMTAIHGKALCPSGKRGARLLWMNLLDVVAVDGIGGLGIAGAGFLILMICMGVGIGINYAGLKV